MAKQKKILLVVGWDGATWKILKPLLKKGKLPYLQKLIKEGISGITESTLPPITAPAWVSFQTGVSPAEHGVFNFVDYRQGSWGEKLKTPADIPFKPFWDILEEKGKSFCIINMPFTSPPPKRKHGIIISSFLTPPGARFVSDKEIQKELEDMGYKIDIKFERYKVFPEREELKKFKGKIYKQILDIAEKRLKAAKLLAQKDRWDYFFVLFQTADFVQHLFWDSKKTQEYYMILDDYLKQLHSLFNKLYKGRVDLILLSDHGFHQAATTQFSINTWLQEVMGKEKVPESSWKRVRSWYQKLKQWGITKERFLFLQKLAKVGLKQERRALIKFREKSPVWATHFGIFLDKEKLGEGYEKIREKLIRQLSELKYRGRPVFQLVEKIEEVYGSPKLEGYPDILFLPGEEFHIDATSFNPKLFIQRKNYPLKGEHTADRIGIFVGYGPSFFEKRGKVDFKIWQLTPLILKTLGVKIPPYMEEEDKVLKDKIEKSKKVIGEALKKYGDNCGIAWTGGKDSMVMLHLVRQVAENRLPLVMFIDHGLHFKQTYKFVDRMKKKWGLKLIIASDEKTAQDLAREKNEEKRRELARIFKIKSIANTVKKRKWKGLFVGIRWDEHPARSEEKYFSKRKDHIRIHPLLHFSEKDIWRYIKKYNLPYNPLYDMGYRSLGEAPFTKPVKDKGLPERAGREKDKEKIMERLRALGYF